MSIAQSLLPEFDHEMASTRKYLELTPAAAAEWKPHAKSMPLGQLAIHLAQLPEWAAMTMQQTELDLSPPGVEDPWPATPFQSTPALVALLDESVRKARAAIAAAPDADFMVPWSLKNAGATIFSMPRIAVLRSFVMNHLIHHRGQYSVYLRLNGVRLPELYGPTADSGN